jgi:hypothetical protein
MERTPEEHWIGNTWNERMLRDAVPVSKCWYDVCENLGISKTRAAVKCVQKWVKKLSLDASHFSDHAVERPKGSRKHPRYTIETLFIIDSMAAPKTVKDWLIKHKLKPYQCEICGNPGVWRAASLSLIMDHINGEHTDHRLENLRFLCPCCNAQQSTFSNGSKSKFVA